MAEIERIPVFPIILGMSEMGRYDEDGSSREFVNRQSMKTIIEFALQEGFTGDETDQALNSIAKGLRKARKIRRQQRVSE